MRGLRVDFCDRMKKMILDDIIAYKKTELQEIKSQIKPADIKSRAFDSEPGRGFAQALSGNGGIRIIAEVKKASPSKGVIREDFDPIEIARTYEDAGASCISVLTDKKFFQGSPDYLRVIRNAVELPLLRKDFIIDDYQIYEARALGADAVLLIAACLDRGQLEDYRGLAGEIGLDALIEAHSYKELDRALLSGGMLIGINNRDLATFSVDLQTTFDLLADIPEDRIVVSESGIKDRADVVRLEKAAVDAVLVGESLLREPDPGKKLKELLGRA